MPGGRRRDTAPVTGLPDPLGPELDTRPPRDPRLPAREYIVCSEPRTGSGLLCRGLVSTGRAGVPVEYFNRRQRQALTARWGNAPDLQSYLAELRARRTSTEGVLGLKIHWDQIERLQAEAAAGPGAPSPLQAIELLAGLFPHAVFIHIRREDVDRQAVSLWTALHTGVWVATEHAGPRPPVAVPYRYKGIADQKTHILEHQAAWKRAFRHAGVEPIDVVYEALVADYAVTIADILQRVTGESVAPAEISESPTLRQSGARSEELVQRFRRDSARLRWYRPAGLIDMPHRVRGKLAPQARDVLPQA